MKPSIKSIPLLAALLLPLFTVPAPGAVIRIVTPYAGAITNEYADTAYGLDLSDSGPMRGLYAQWLDTGRFQANAFYYQAPDVNYSRVEGLHLNFDVYFLASKSGKWAVGGGLENLSIDMSAGSAIPGLTSFDLDNRVRFYYARAGRYFYQSFGGLETSLLPYAGLAREEIDGEVALDPAGFAPLIRSEIKSSDRHAMAGLNLKAVFRHFLEVQWKWMGRFKEEGRLDEYSFLANIYLNRHWGLSYRYKFMEYGSSSNSYGLAGLVYCF